jgi:hypothetical protein
MPTREPSPPDQNGHSADPATNEFSDPLAEAAARAARLVAGLKQYRRERRSLQAAWSSLRQLNLGP